MRASVRVSVRVSVCVCVCVCDYKLSSYFIDLIAFDQTMYYRNMLSLKFHHVLSQRIK